MLRGEVMPTLREARRARLLTIRDLAAKAGVSTKTVVDVEAGRVAPKFRTIRRLAAALELRPSEIAEFRATIEAAPTRPVERTIDQAARQGEGDG
jgi:transcriptional regulator with XRE-family HTH domain